MDGFLVIDKPPGITSHDVVQKVRRLCGLKKVGHTGTLDPFATGVLPVALGQGTKVIPFLDEAMKEYRATMRLGSATDTQDCTGQPVWTGEWRQLTAGAIRQAADTFTGTLGQIPPMYSALKRDGIPLYRLARAGTVVEREARTIEVHSLVIETIELPDVTFLVRCSRGTYVRTLAHDLGERLGCGAHLTALRRLVSGPFTEAGALTLDELAGQAGNGWLRDRLCTPFQALGHLPAIELTAGGARKVTCGVSPEVADLVEGSALPPAGTRVRLALAGSLLAVADVADGLSLRLLRVFG